MLQLQKLCKKRLTDKPDEMPEEEWTKILAARKAVTADRYSHHGGALERKRVAMEEEMVKASAEAYMQIQAIGGTQGSSTAHRSTSPSLPRFFDKSGSFRLPPRPRSLFSSPEIGENRIIQPDDGAGVFSPIIPDDIVHGQNQGRAHLDLNQATQDGSPTFRRGALQFNTTGACTSQSGRSLFGGQVRAALEVLDEMDESACVSAMNA